MKVSRYIIIFSMLILCSIGLLMVYSSSNVWALYRFGSSFKYLKSQLLFFIVGLLFISFIYKVDLDFIKKNSNKLLFLSLILLVLVLIPGIGKVRNGSRSWFGIGSFGVQPSEFCKLCLIIYSSKYLSNNDNLVKDIKKGIFPLLFIILLSFFLIMLEPDFGTGLLILVTNIAIIFVAGPNIKFFVRLFIIALMGLSGLIVVAPYRVARIVSYLNPWSDPLGSGFQIIQSLYAMGPNGLFGLGFNNSIQKNFYLPEPQTDFIFSILSEELGFVGCFIVIILILLIFLSGIYISINQKDLFKKYFSFGLVFSLSIQSLLNILIVSGLLPTTGVTLPFLSYGGSSLLISMISIGLVLNVSKYRR